MNVGDYVNSKAVTEPIPTIGDYARLQDAADKADKAGAPQTAEMTRQMASDMLRKGRK